MVKVDSETPCFVRVKCTDCENEQVIFSHASSEVNCEVCGKTLASPQGGKAEINSEILEIVG
ncbi:30S ribosomal protein S27 [candidate division MSBL1 archaeon SCGC-AAA259I09]|uniref:Small ribosomal subunit protein eS27 n=2 Tax=candidate division MSBL1 TaxID=215777 RepID=A0A133UVF2_9EURY|nr:30S ribosomal protein S27 [candidate division MSBL1 archaeon SCGC-AAA259I09]KXB00795.1 30S ribosomal protein S27 [candidate division MSBL1 archaeon SCGC-AAA259M10]